MARECTAIGTGLAKEDHDRMRTCIQPLSYDNFWTTQTTVWIRMTDDQSPTNPSTTPPSKPAAATKSRLALRIRVIAFVILVLACGWYMRFFQSTWTTFFPRTCANGNAALFVVDFDALPARMGDQKNLCADVGDGECRRTDGEELLYGECRSGRMHGPWSLENVKTGVITWSGTYCNGLPCGEFHQRIDAEHENVFRVEKLHLHGPATIWKSDGERFIELSGHYEHSKRKGRWVHRVDPSHAMLAASIYDENGFVTTTSLYCTNGNRQETRGRTIFLFDAQGNLLAKRTADERETTPAIRAMDPALCPLP
jgi:hypothetical protein